MSSPISTIQLFWLLIRFKIFCVVPNFQFLSWSSLNSYVTPASNSQPQFLEERGIYCLQVLRDVRLISDRLAVTCSPQWSRETSRPSPTRELTPGSFSAPGTSVSPATRYRHVRVRDLPSLPTWHYTLYTVRCAVSFSHLRSPLRVGTSRNFGDKFIFSCNSPWQSSELIVDGSRGGVFETWPKPIMHYFYLFVLYIEKYLN